MAQFAGVQFQTKLTPVSLGKEVPLAVLVGVEKASEKQQYSVQVPAERDDSMCWYTKCL